LTVARKTVEKHVLHWHQLYEQQKKKKATSEEMAFILDRYTKRWQRWATAGLQGIAIELYNKMPGTLKNLQYQPISIPVNRQVIIQRHRKIFFTRLRRVNNG
jgi:hypothetical protein